jgi:hypothetical protein
LVVIIFAIDAGGIRRSASLARRTAPEDRSIRYATFAGVSNGGALARAAVEMKRAAAEAKKTARFIDSGFVLLGWLEDLPIGA